MFAPHQTRVKARLRSIRFECRPNELFASVLRTAWMPRERLRVYTYTVAGGTFHQANPPRRTERSRSPRISRDTGDFGPVRELHETAIGLEHFERRTQDVGLHLLAHRQQAEPLTTASAMPRSEKTVVAGDLLELARVAADHVRFGKTRLQMLEKRFVEFENQQIVRLRCRARSAPA